MDALDVGGIVDRCVGELHVDLLLLAGALQDVEDALALVEGDGHGLQDPAVGRDQLHLFRVAEVQIVPVSIIMPPTSSYSPDALA